MTNLQFKDYGFSYQYNGHEFALSVVASSKEEAISKLAAMRDAIFVGEVKMPLLLNAVDGCPNVELRGCALLRSPA